MATKITTEMMITAHGSLGPEAVGKVRRLLTMAGVKDVELHPYEVEAIRTYREKARAFTAQADRYLAAGPLPYHTCIVDELGTVRDAGSCPYGCKPDGPRWEVE